MHKGIQANVDAQLARLEAFRSVLEEMFRNSSGGAGSSARQTILFASVLKLVHSASVVRVLAETGSVEEVLSIGHTLVEVAVNAAYLQVAASREVDRFLRFQPEAQQGQLALAGARADGFAATVSRRVQEAFSFRRSNQPASWSAQDLMGRASIADQQSRIPVMVPMVARCFHRGQGAVQGSVGSLEVFMNSVRSRSGPRADTRMAELTEALFGVNLCLLTMCLYLNAAFHLQMDDAIDEAADAETLTRSPALSADSAARQQLFPERDGNGRSPSFEDEGE